MNLDDLFGHILAFLPFILFILIKTRSPKRKEEHTPEVNESSKLDELPRAPSPSIHSREVSSKKVLKEGVVHPSRDVSKSIKGGYSLKPAESQPVPRPQLTASERKRLFLIGKLLFDSPKGWTK